MDFMLILYPRLKNGNVLWSCDNCNKTAEITSADTQVVAIYCMLKTFIDDYIIYYTLYCMEIFIYEI